MISDGPTYAASIRVFVNGYISHKTFMYINYMEKAKLWASFLEFPAENFTDFSDLPQLSAPDICRRCKFRFAETAGGRLRDYCYNCTIGWPEDAVSNYEVTELSKIIGICHDWMEIFFATYYTKLPKLPQCRPSQQTIS